MPSPTHAESLKINTFQISIEGLGSMVVGSRLGKGWVVVHTAGNNDAFPLGRVRSR